MKASTSSDGKNAEEEEEAEAAAAAAAALPVAEAAAEEAAALASEMSESKIRPASTGELRLQAVQKRRQHPAVASFFHCLFAAFFRKAELRGAAAEARSAAGRGRRGGGRGRGRRRG